MGFCSEDDAQRFLGIVPAVEKAMTESGILVVKYWLEVGEAEQTKRLQARIDDPRKIWKLSDMDLLSFTKWNEYGHARDDMLEKTSSEWAPWHVVRTDDKRRGRLNLITHLLSLVPYTPLEPRSIELPERPPEDGGNADLTPYLIPTPF
jgi:polyphosphate kinase 2 (PPK2 family)